MAAERILVTAAGWLRPRVMTSQACGKWDVSERFSLNGVWISVITDGRSEGRKAGVEGDRDGTWDERPETLLRFVVACPFGAFSWS
jgi:hypothetical protein